MPFDLALFDLVAPYVLRGRNLGNWHAALSIIFVSEHEISADEGGTVIRGIAQFSGAVDPPALDPSTGTLSVAAVNTEGHPQNDPSRRDPWFEIRDLRILFQLTAPRMSSIKVANAVTAIGGAAGFANAAAVLTALDNNPLDAPPSDYPSTEFTLDMVFSGVILRPPFLRPAKLETDGLLVPDTTKSEVKFTLPRIKVRLSQGSQVNDQLVFTLLSAGASGLDDPGDLAVAELITMDPPYAFIGNSNVVGFGFRSATLDLSDGSTPPEILSQFGFDESWTGLYLPEVRLFVAPNGMQDLAVSAGARNLLIGLGQTPGITGDFDLSVIDQGAGPLKLSARFFDADGRGIGITKQSDAQATVQLPVRTRMVVDIDGGRAPFNAQVSFDGGAQQGGRLHDVDMTGVTEKTIVITVTDSRPNNPGPTTLTIRASRRAAIAPAPGMGTQPQIPPVDLQTTTVTQNGVTVNAPRLRLVDETSSTATISLDPPNANTQWMVGGNAAGTSATVTVNAPPGSNVGITAIMPGGANAGPFEIFFRFDQPPPTGNAATFGPGNTGTSPAPDDGATATFPPGPTVQTKLNPLGSLTNGDTINVKGYASFEDDNSAQKVTYNTALCERRAEAVRGLIQQQFPGKNFNVVPSTDMNNWETHKNPRNVWWKAVVDKVVSGAPGTTTTGTVSRRNVEQPPVPPPIVINDPPPVEPDPPSWFMSAGVKVRIVRNTFVACEVFGRFNIQTKAEEHLSRNGMTGQDIPQFQGLGSQNPADGIIDVRVVVQIDDATDTVSVIGYFGADPADRDGLLMTGQLQGQPLQPKNKGRSALGMMAVFTPVLAEVAPANPLEGDIGQIALTGAVVALPFTLAALNWVNVERIIWYGGEIAVRVRNTGPEVSVLLDIETAVSVNIQIGNLRLIEIDREFPLVVRYKAIGLRFGYTPPETKFQFRPVFDASKGYTIEVTRGGAIKIVDPLGQILQILAARIARNNPLIFEIDLGFSIDLGVISIERARVRMSLDPVGPPELTAFAAGIDVPGAIRGRGYMELNEVEIKGQIDVTIVPVQVRIAAGLGVANIPESQGGPATGVIITLEVEFPVAIPLANSGLGIYGFLGLFAMNYSRNEDQIPAGTQAPALAWLRATGGNPANIQFWKPKVNTWAFGIGATLGTMGTSFIFNLKGVVLLELPGPRLLLMMKAKLLQDMPALKSTAEGLLFAVIDLDMGRGTLTIGISVEYTVNPLLSIRIPVEAFFNFNQTSDWHLYLGRYDDPIHAKILEVFEGSGYLMLSGNGIPAHGGLPAVTGFAIATGLHVSIVWGSTSIGLYLKVSAGFDAVVGTDPFRLAGILYIRGNLHLFIIDIGAYAQLKVDIGEDAQGNKICRIEGEICGKIDFFFFTIEGCVDFVIGENAVPVPDPPALARTMKLVSRTPALVVGTGVDKPIDGGIGDAPEGNSQPAANTIPVVPIDAIPVLLMSAPPLEDGVLKFNGEDIGGTSEAPAPGQFVQRGDTFYEYTLKSVELTGPVTAGKTPATWWKQKSGDTALEAQLALLSWIPEPTPKAIEKSKFLEETVKENWGTVCWPAAPPTAVLWTFRFELIGPSETGWVLDGEAWPDPPNTVRSVPTDLTLKVTERWRCGNASIDNLRGVVAAQVEANAVVCPVKPGTPGTVGGLTSVVTGVLSGAPTAPVLPTLVASATAALVAGQPDVIFAARGRKLIEPLPAQQSTLTELRSRVAAGVSVSRATLATAVLSPEDRNNDPAPKQCAARALAAPLLDGGALTLFGDETRRERVKRALEALKYRPSKLDDAVCFHTGQFEYAKFFLLVPRKFIGTQTVQVVATNAKGDVLNQHFVNFTDMVPPAAFPAQWTSTSGPWWDDVELARRFSTGYRPTNGYLPVMVEMKGRPDADRIEIGVTDQGLDWHKKNAQRPYYVCAIEALRTSEVKRFDWDKSEQKKKQGVLESVLGVESADHALLMPDQTYQVRITWDAKRERRPADGGVTDKKTVANVSQSFWFRTDNEPPRRLDPWMLVALPGDGEKHYFGAEALNLVFGTNNVARIYDAYGKKLQVRLKASSMRHPKPGPGVQHPLPLNDLTMKPVAASVLSPWEGVIEDLFENSCIPVNVERMRHTKVTIPIPLDKLTDYVLDIEMLDKTAADGDPGESVFRMGFSTGVFGKLEDFAKAFQVARVEHRYAGLNKLQPVGAMFAVRAPEGAELDTELMKAGLEPLPVPEYPRSVVFWEQPAGNVPPQPAAVIIDASEPMWRSRRLPTELTDPGPNGGTRYEMLVKTWLQLVQQPGGDAIVDQIVPSPGGQRALITLKPGSRGKRLRLALRKIAQTEKYLDGPGAADQFHTVADLILTGAPWEE